MRAIICGGRNYAKMPTFTSLLTAEELELERGRVRQETSRLQEALSSLPLTEIAEGGATGADFAASVWARMTGVPVKTFDADWNGYRRQFAGQRRNQRMLDEFKPDLVIAFPGGNGTADMVKRAGIAGVLVNLVCPHCYSLDCRELWPSGRKCCPDCSHK